MIIIHRRRVGEFSDAVQIFRLSFFVAHNFVGFAFEAKAQKRLFDFGFTRTGRRIKTPIANETNISGCCSVGLKRTVGRES